MQIKIGPCRIADEYKTHEAGATLDNPSQALVALAEAGTCDPISGLPYAEKVVEPTPALAPAAEAAPETVEENA